MPRLTADEQITYEERAAIIEYYGGVDRSEAERRAKKISDGRGAEPEQMNLIEPEYKSMLREFYRR
jgi:hypothetical protein